MPEPIEAPDSIVMDADPVDLVLDADGNRQQAGGYVLTTAGWRPLQDFTDNS